jgi:hypothetical protein
MESILISGTDLGQTWYFGVKPVLIRFYTPNYTPQFLPAKSVVRNEEVSEWIEIGKDWVTRDALDFCNISAEKPKSSKYKLSSELTTVSC